MLHKSHSFIERLLCYNLETLSKKMNNKLKIIICGSIAILLIFGLGVLFTKDFLSNNTQNCDASKYKSINLALVCSDPPKVNKKNYIEFKARLTEVIEQKKSSGDIINASVYFRDLNNGPTFGIEEYSNFSPASLLKLPLFLTYLNLEQENPGLLDVEVAFKDPNIDFEQNFPPKYSADESKTYTVRELLRYMIQYSDNQSYYILTEYLNEISPNHNALKETFTDLGIINPKDELDQTINVKSYGSIFVQLYHSSYLTDKDSSEYALDILSGSDFTNGLSLGLPDGIRVAHKFGERSGAGINYKQLHDCGIVYYPENPYLVCIMTQGYSFDKLTKTIGLFSKMIYEEFDSRSIKQ